MNFRITNYSGYNIAANFLSKENYIITGSEDNQVRHNFLKKFNSEILQKIYIYDKEKGNVKNIIKTKGKINHLVNIKRKYKP